jgi:malate/lactate dehydrogenase
MENRLRKPTVASKHEGIDPSEEISFGAQLDAKRAKLYVDKPVNERLDEASEPNLGHHGEPEERMQDLSARMAWNQSKFNKVDTESEDTFGKQLVTRHEVDEETAKTIEELLADAEHYYSDDEMEVLLSTLEELLSKQHKGY